MRLQILGANQTLVTLNNGTEIFFSYETPVAGWHNGVYFKTEKKWSNTTSRHISAYLGGFSANTMKQEWIDQLGEQS